MRYFSLFLLVIALCTCQRKITPPTQNVATPTVYTPPVTSPPAPLTIPTEEEQAKNIILLIGDGMGLTQVSTAYVFGKQMPNFSRFKHIGLHENRPIGKIITDSASGATAFSTGFKSYNSAIGVDKDTIPRETILEWAAKQNKATGVISTSSITHATPASFFSHVARRSQQEDIALDFLRSPVNFAAGGGTKWFNEREDKRDLLAELEARGTEVSTNVLNKNPKLGRKHLYLLAHDGMKKMSEGRGDFLPQATATAIDFLANDEDGFFLMVEGSQIDWGGHDNDGDYVIKETLDFDQAIGKALDFAEQDGNTLVVVTADHETGGLSLSSQTVFGRSDYGIVKPTFSTGGHSAALIPVFAFGPGAERFMGIYQNNDIYGKMMAAFGKR
ncbi:MAG: alkaline phosphatase [Bacteroidota bacterium]